MSSSSAIRILNALRWDKISYNFFVIIKQHLENVIRDIIVMNITNITFRQQIISSLINSQGRSHDDCKNILKALDRSLDILSPQLKQQVMFKLTNEFHISLNACDDMKCPVLEDIEQALKDIFRTGSSLLLGSFYAELDKLEKEQ